MSEHTERNRATDMWLGVGLTLVLHAIVAAILWFAVHEPTPLLFIGVIQLPYIVIASLLFLKKAPGISAGVWIGAGITFLLNAACFGIGFGWFFVRGG